MSDEGLHEIRLNGKQLVFLFMAATVVAVVIFLCGVMVGRGVRVPPGAELTAVAAAASADPTASVSLPASSASRGAPATSRETLTYPDRLETNDPPAETLKEAPAAAAPVAGEPPPPVSESADASTALASAAVAAVAGEPAGNGFVVQVAAVRARAEAEVIARRLSTKGYPAFVTTAGGSAARVFRVRIGKYKDRREAEAVASRLEKEEQFKPWITR
jgi:cell division septation protein DedD